jgi:hypothetical protein
MAKVRALPSFSPISVVTSTLSISCSWTQYFLTIRKRASSDLGEFFPEMLLHQALPKIRRGLPDIKTFSRFSPQDMEDQVDASPCISAFEIAQEEIVELVFLAQGAWVSQVLRLQFSTSSIPLRVSHSVHSRLYGYGYVSLAKHETGKLEARNGDIAPQKMMAEYCAKSFVHLATATDL